MFQPTQIFAQIIASFEWSNEHYANGITFDIWINWEKSCGYISILLFDLENRACKTPQKYWTIFDKYKFKKVIKLILNGVIFSKCVNKVSKFLQFYVPISIWS